MLTILFNQSSGVAPPPPAAPSDLTATTVSQTEIALAWVDNSSNEDGFRIDRSPDGVGSWVQIAEVAAGTIAYSDTGLDPATTYYYRVKAYNAGGDSAYSNTASATTLAEEIAGGGGGGGAWRVDQEQRQRREEQRRKQEQARKRLLEERRVRKKREVETAVLAIAMWEASYV